MRVESCTAFEVFCDQTQYIFLSDADLISTFEAQKFQEILKQVDQLINAGYHIKIQVENSSEWEIYEKKMAAMVTLTTRYEKFCSERNLTCFSENDSIIDAFKECKNCEPVGISNFNPWPNVPKKVKGA